MINDVLRDTVSCECAWRCEFMEANTHGYQNLKENKRTFLDQSGQGGESLTHPLSSVSRSVAGGLDCARPLPCSPRLSQSQDESRVRPFSWPQLQPGPTWDAREHGSSPWIPRTPLWEATPQLTTLTQTASCDCVRCVCVRSREFHQHLCLSATLAVVGVAPSDARTRSSWMTLRRYEARQPWPRQSLKLVGGTVNRNHHANATPRHTKGSRHFQMIEMKINKKL